jgi:hypothetical protein
MRVRVGVRACVRVSVLCVPYYLLPKIIHCTQFFTMCMVIIYCTKLFTVQNRLHCVCVCVCVCMCVCVCVRACVDVEHGMCC